VAPLILPLFFKKLRLPFTPFRMVVDWCFFVFPQPLKLDSSNRIPGPPPVSVRRPAANPPPLLGDMNPQFTPPSCRREPPWLYFMQRSRPFALGSPDFFGEVLECSGPQLSESLSPGFCFESTFVYKSPFSRFFPLLPSLAHFDSFIADLILLSNEICLKATTFFLVFPLLQHSCTRLPSPPQGIDF